MHTHTRAHTHACTQVRTHTHTHTHTNTHTHTHVHSHTHTHILHTHIHAHTHMHEDTHSALTIDTCNCTHFKMTPIIGGNFVCTCSLLLCNQLTDPTHCPLLLLLQRLMLSGMGPAWCYNAASSSVLTLWSWMPPQNCLRWFLRCAVSPLPARGQVHCADSYCSSFFVPASNGSM